MNRNKQKGESPFLIQIHTASNNLSVHGENQTKYLKNSYIDGFFSEGGAGLSDGLVPAVDQDVPETEGG